MSDPNKSRDVKDILTEFQSNKESAPAHDGSCSSDPATGTRRLVLLGSGTGTRRLVLLGSGTGTRRLVLLGSGTGTRRLVLLGSGTGTRRLVLLGSGTGTRRLVLLGSGTGTRRLVLLGSGTGTRRLVLLGSGTGTRRLVLLGSGTGTRRLVLLGSGTAHDGSCSSDPAPAPSSDEGAGANQARNVIFVGNKPIMTYVTATLTQLSSLDVVTIKARGQKITRAVDISQMISKRMDSVGYVVSKVRISSDSLTSQDGKERKVSTIEIDIAKT